MNIRDFRHDDFEIETLEDELRVEELCRSLLQQFYLNLQEKEGLTPEKASELAYSADYYLRDYVVDALRQNILKPHSGQLRYFAGTWYCTRTMEPEYAVLEVHIEAVSRFYCFLSDLGLVSMDELDIIRKETADLEFYRERLESFLGLSGDGYEKWLSLCPADMVDKGEV